MRHDTICIVPKPAPLKVSWWIQHAQPEQRSGFIDAAKLRDVERTKLADTVQGKKNQLIRHIIDPRAYQPKVRKGKRA